MPFLRSINFIGLRLVLILFAAYLELYPNPSAAATFTEFSDSGLYFQSVDSDVRLILMDGPVENGDAEKFIEVIADSPKVTLILRGPGGRVQEAYQIGAELNSRGYATMVLPGTECYSSCAVIWLSGARRYMSETSTIGFHQVSSLDGEVSGQGNAEYGAFLNAIGINKFGVKYLSAKSPSDIENLSPLFAWAYGIDIYLQDGLNIQTPLDRPSMPTIARQFSKLGFLAANCAEAMGFDQRSLKRKAYEIGELPNEVAGELWIEAFTLELDLLKMRTENSNNFQICAEIIQDLSQFTGLLEHVDPSFDCALAGTQDEHSICQNQTLSALDRGLSYFYDQLLNSSQSDKAAHQKVQRAWVSLRQGCGNDTQCISDLYLTRLFQIQRILNDQVLIVPSEIAPKSDQEHPQSIVNLISPSEEHATVLQLGLAFWGYYDGMQDGDWGPRSASAMAKHQDHLNSQSIKQSQMQNLVDTLKYEYSQYGWEYGDHHGIGASYLFPTKGVERIDPFLPGGGQAFIWENSVVISVGRFDFAAATAAHESLMQLHDQNFGQPYLIRRNDLMVTVAQNGDGFSHLRSERGPLGWSTLYVNAGSGVEGYYWALVGSFSPSRSRDFSLFQLLSTMK